MRLVRFRWGDGIFYGVLAGEMIRPLARPPFEGLSQTEEEIPLAEVVLLAPCEPSKIVALGLNYRDHAAEFGSPLPEEPLLFLKPGTAVIGPDADIVYPQMSRQVDFEAELAVVMGRTARRVSQAAAFEYILGYTAINDVTARDLQKKDGQFTRSKSFDTFAPLGPWIETEISNPDNLTV